MEIPKEIWHKILTYLDDKSLSKLLQTNQRLYAIATSSYLWLRIAIIQIPCAKSSLMQLYKSVNFYRLYSNVLVKYGKLIGFWNSDYSFFHGGLLQVKLEIQDQNYCIVGYCLNPDEFHADDSTAFSLDRSISIERIQSIGYSKKQLFRITGLEIPKLECVPSDSTSHPCDIESINVESKASLPTPLNIDAFEISERIQAKQFPLGKPNSSTGLWPYPSPVTSSEETLAESPEFNVTKENCVHVVSIKCNEQCHIKRIRSVVMNNQGITVPQTFLYIPNYSLIKFEESQTFDLKIDKPWIGFYGNHGNEFIHLSIGMDPFEGTHRDCLIGTKITGDFNVPRGEITFFCYIDETQDYLGVEQQFKLEKCTEFNNCRVFSGQARVAQMSYMGASLIPCQGT